MDREQTKKRLSIALLLAQVESYDLPAIEQSSEKPNFSRKSIIETPIEIQANNTHASHNRNINCRHGSGKGRC